MLKITNKHFLYSTSAFALVLQMGFSLPSFAMNDGSKEEKKVVARKTPSSSSSSSSASSSSSSGRSDRSSLKDLGSAPSYTSQANNSQGSNLRSDPPSYISLSSSSSQAPSYLDEMSMALSDSTINKTSKKHDTDKEVDLENLAKLGKHLETIVKEENASSTRLANTISKFYYRNTNYYKSTGRNLVEFWMIRDRVKRAFDDESIDQNTRFLLKKETALFLLRGKKASYHPEAAAYCLELFRSKECPEQIRMQAATIFGQLSCAGYKGISREGRCQCFYEAARSDKLSLDDKTVAQIQLLQEFVRGSTTLIDTKKAQEWAKQIRDNTNLKPAYRKEGRDLREQMKDLIAKGKLNDKGIVEKPPK